MSSDYLCSQIKGAHAEVGAALGGELDKGEDGEKPAEWRHGFETRIPAVLDRLVEQVPKKLKDATRPTKEARKQRNMWRHS